MNIEARWERSPRKRKMFILGGEGVFWTKGCAGLADFLALAGVLSLVSAVHWFLVTQDELD